MIWLLFAVDSVKAIAAQANDQFLLYISVVFAVLGLRATSFIIDVLVQLLSFELRCGGSADFHWRQAHHWSHLPYPIKHCLWSACHSLAWKSETIVKNLKWNQSLKNEAKIDRLKKVGAAQEEDEEAKL